MLFRVAALIGLSAVSAASWDAQAHPGGLDKNGCHHDRKNGGYHCHRGATASSTALGLIGRPALAAASSGASFRSCAEARAAGAAPLRTGQPGYSTRLDRDRDGVACE
jgi:hypothetical protein